MESDCDSESELESECQSFESLTLNNQQAKPSYELTPAPSQSTIISVESDAISAASSQSSKLISSLSQSSEPYERDTMTQHTQPLSGQLDHAFPLRIDFHHQSAQSNHQPSKSVNNQISVDRGLRRKRNVNFAESVYSSSSDQIEGRANRIGTGDCSDNRNDNNTGQVSSASAPSLTRKQRECNIVSASFGIKQKILPRKRKSWDSKTEMKECDASIAFKKAKHALDLDADCLKNINAWFPDWEPDELNEVNEHTNERDGNNGNKAALVSPSRGKLSLSQSFCNKSLLQSKSSLSNPQSRNNQNTYHNDLYTASSSGSSVVASNEIQVEGRANDMNIINSAQSASLVSNAAASHSNGSYQSLSKTSIVANDHPVANGVSNRVINPFYKSINPDTFFKNSKGIRRNRRHKARYKSRRQQKSNVSNVRGSSISSISTPVITHPSTINNIRHQSYARHFWPIIIPSSSPSPSFNRNEEDSPSVGNVLDNRKSNTHYHVHLQSQFF